MFKGALGALGAGYNLIDSWSGGKISKFAMKNIGKASGWIANKVMKNKPEWKEAVASVTSVAGDVFGDDNELGKNLHNASKVMRGEDVHWRSHDDGDKHVDVTAPTAGALQHYNKNIGGTNYQRYRPRAAKRGKIQPKSVRVKAVGKFSKKAKRSSVPAPTPNNAKRRTQ